ncbi:MAG: hypothetical protein KGN98_01640 [Alphaproteobacteria bacterium]|nr:hypothetical protein [Alphaproteobacteria bacterium]
MARKRITYGLWAASCVAIALALPALGQDRPESILPPGFGDAPEAPARRPEQAAPARTPTAPRPPAAAPMSPAIGAPIASGDPASDIAAGPTDPSLENATSAAAIPDIPPQARRPGNRVGLLGRRDGDMGAAAFAGMNGRYLTGVMRHLDAPIASRWASIVLRRALLSRADTPANVSHADWAAERAWLLVRMGEAVSARNLVQAVDVDQYSPALYAFGMQASLASADPAALCPMTIGADVNNRDTAWTLARAICSAFSGEGSLATAQLDRARSRRGDNDVDVLLAEKVVGAAQDARRAVTINWDAIQRLDVWRYGMATATGLQIPDRLMQSVNVRVQAWRAQAPLLSYTQRLPDAERAASMGILSSAALVDFYGAAFAEQDPADDGNPLFDLLRDSYAGGDEEARVDSMARLWARESDGPWQAYARQIVTARAAARIRPSADLADQAPKLIEAMLSAGLDRYAARWLSVVSEAGDDLSWGYLAVASPRPISGVTASRIQDFGSASENDGDLRARMLFAGLAALGRVPGQDVASIADKMGVALGRRSRWTDALDRAVQLHAPGAVAILCAVGLQADNWSDIPPEHLYHIVSALRRVGLEPEARMIAAEAVTRA